MSCTRAFLLNQMRDPFPSWQKGLLVDYSFHICFSYVILFVPMRCVLLRVPYCSGTHDWMNKEMTVARLGHCQVLCCSQLNP